MNIADEIKAIWKALPFLATRKVVQDEADATRTLMQQISEAELEERQRDRVHFDGRLDDIEATLKQIRDGLLTPSKPPVTGGLYLGPPVKQ